MTKPAPIIPDGTCPHIDHIVTMVDELERFLVGGDKKYNDNILETIRNELEVVRRANELLRESSLFWHNKCKRLGNNSDK
jgi:hypothetical protein